MQSSLLKATALLSVLMLAACNFSGSDDDAQQSPSLTTAADENGGDAMGSRDSDTGVSVDGDIRDSESRPLMQAQVVLERLGFGSGIIDGTMGASSTNAITGFQEARDLPVTGKLDEATTKALAQWDNIPATRIVTIPQSWGEITFAPVPEGAAQQAEMALLGYEGIAEKLAERFHTTPDVLAQLNPGGKPASMKAEQARSAASTKSAEASDGRRKPPSGTSVTYTAGQKVRVPNVGADRIDASTVDNKGWLETLRSLGVGTDQPSVAKILVDESEGWLKAYDKDDQLVAMFTVTTGSQNDPLPIGTWKVTGVAYNPPFAYDPKLFWDVPDSKDSQQLPPGPNGPVGVVWIDLTKDHYGIHGTPAPETIGRAQSHGCVRLTNWDAARLAQMVSPGTQVVFQG